MMKKIKIVLVFLVMIYIINFIHIFYKLNTFIVNDIVVEKITYNPEIDYFNYQIQKINKSTYEKVIIKFFIITSVGFHEYIKIAPGNCYHIKSKKNKKFLTIIKINDELIIIYKSRPYYPLFDFIGFKVLNL